MILARDVNMAVGLLLLEMAAQTKRGIARNQHSGVHRAMRIVAGRATLAQRFVLENERSELPRVALGADIFLRHEFRAAPHDHGTLVRIMTIAATDLSLKDRVMRWQVELGPLVQVTLKTCLRRFAGIDDGVGGAARLIVKAAGAVTRFTADIFGVVARSLQTMVARRLEVAVNLLVTLLARFRAGIGRPGNLRWRHFHPVYAGAGNHPNSSQCPEQQKQRLLRTIFQPGNNLTNPAIQVRLHHG